jgi:hypothetical protein
VLPLPHDEDGQRVWRWSESPALPHAGDQGDQTDTGKVMPMTWFNWLTFGLSVLAFSISLWAGWNAHLSRQASQRSADAAEQTIRERRFKWSVTRISESTSTIRNEGTVTALDVSATTGAEIEHVLRDDGPISLRPGEAFNIDIQQLWGEVPHDFVIEWTPDLPDAERQTWVEPWPANPNPAPPRDKRR